MVAVVSDTYTTTLKTYPSQSYLSRGNHLLMKTISIGPSHMESSTGFSQGPLKQRFATFDNRTISFCCFLSYCSSEPFKPPSKDKKDFNIFREASSFPFPPPPPPPHHIVPPQRDMQFQQTPIFLINRN